MRMSNATDTNMPPHSRGPPRLPTPLPPGVYSKSTPNLPTLQSLKSSQASLHPDRAIAISPDSSTSEITSASKPASIADFPSDANHGPPSLSLGSSDEEDSGGEEDGQVPNLPQRPMYQHHSRSHSYLAHSAFAPPFYGRPPMPLPPSPSLTSLLRPTFSTQNSRPATPEPSSDEGTPHIQGDITGTQTPSSAAASALTSTFRTAKPIPRASPKVPTYEYYGFTLYLTSSLAFIVYVLWAFLPSPFLTQLGISYYPNRWWALAIPAWTVMLMVYIYVALAAYNVGHLTLPLNSVESLVDEASSVAVVDNTGKIIRNELASWRSQSPDAGKSKAVGGKRFGAKGRPGGHNRQGSLTKFPVDPELDWRSLWNEGTDAVMDIPIGGVCEILYGDDDGSVFRDSGND